MILYCLIPESVYPQEDKSALGLEVKVEEDYEPLGASRIIVYKDARHIETLKTNKKGQAMVELDLNGAYTLKFSKESYVSKKIVVNTNLPDDEKGFWRIGFTIDLFKKYPGLDVSALEDPVTKIEFKEKQGDFGYDEAYTRKMMEQVDQILAQLKELRENAYKRTIREGNRHFNRQEYKKSIQYYQRALRQRPHDEQPQEKISEAQRKLKEYAEMQRLYMNAIERADTLFEGEEYEKAREVYYEGLGYDDSRVYPVKQIGKIDSILILQEDRSLTEKEKREKYRGYIEWADKQFGEDNYKPAKISYQNALVVFPEKQYPRQQIDTINGILAKMKQQNRKNKAYQKLVEVADECIGNKLYYDAKTLYTEALIIMPDKEYPRRRIARIDEIIERKKDIHKKYATAIERGDDYFHTGMYWLARNAYQDALAIKPGENYPMHRINMTNGILQSKYRQQRYRNIIAEADLAFEKDNYTATKQKYQDTIDIKSDADYLKERTGRINGEVAILGSEKTPPTMEFGSDRERADYLKEVTEKYPEDITVEYYTLKTLRIKRVVVNYDCLAADYRKIQHNWGGTFYFRNGQAISKEVFRVETRGRDR